MFFLAIKSLYISKKRQENKERKGCSVWLRHYLTRRANKGYFNNLMRELTILSARRTIKFSQHTRTHIYSLVTQLGFLSEKSYKARLSYWNSKFLFKTILYDEFTMLRKNFLR